MTEPPLNWIQQIHTTLIDAKQIPLSGYAPAIDWKNLSKAVGSLLQCDQLLITPGKAQILNAEAITKGLGNQFTPITLELLPLEGQVFFVMNKDEMGKLTTLALTPSSGPLTPRQKGFSSPKFQEGFYYYLATQVVEAIDTLRCFGDLKVKMGIPAPLPQEEALCVDLEIRHSKHTFWGRLICPASFHKHFKSHFATYTAPTLSSRIAKQMDVTTHLCVGETHLSLAQWKHISVGDCLVLDRCSYDPNTHKGSATLSLENTSIFRIKIKETNIKIIDYVTYQQEINPMYPKEPEEEEFSPDEIPLDETEAGEMSEEDAEGKHLWSPENGDMEKLISTPDIPLTITVEIARLTINLDKLLRLSPGNVLELPVKPEHGVDLIIGGKKVAKGELIKLGEMIGVKILQLGE